MAPTAPAHTGTGARQLAQANGDASLCVTRKQEARVDELLQRISPNLASEARRHSVAQFVTEIITRCFAPACEVLVAAGPGCGAAGLFVHSVSERLHRSSPSCSDLFP